MPKSHRDRPATNRFDIVVAGPPPEPDPEAVAEAAVETSQPPSRAADKAEWVAYAELLGIDASGTKTQIVERVRNG